MLITNVDYRLSPHYDLLSTRADGQLSSKLAMRIGKQHRADFILKEHRERLAEDAGVDAKAVLDHCGEMSEKVPELARPLAAAFAAE